MVKLVLILISSITTQHGPVRDDFSGQILNNVLNFLRRSKISLPNGQHILCNRTSTLKH